MALRQRARERGSLWPGLGASGPTLEIYQYENGHAALPTAANRPGFGHLALVVPDVAEARATFLSEGGDIVGDVVTSQKLEDSAGLGRRTRSGRRLAPSHSAGSPARSDVYPADCQSRQGVWCISGSARAVRIEPTSGHRMRARNRAIAVGDRDHRSANEACAAHSASSGKADRLVMPCPTNTDARMKSARCGLRGRSGP